MLEEFAVERKNDSKSEVTTTMQIINLGRFIMRDHLHGLSTVDGRFLIDSRCSTPRAGDTVGRK